MEVSNFFLQKLIIPPKGLKAVYLVQSESQDIQDQVCSGAGKASPRPELRNILAQLKPLFLKSTTLGIDKSQFDFLEITIIDHKDGGQSLTMKAKCFDPVSMNDFQVTSPRINLKETYFDKLEMKASESLKKLENEVFEYYYRKGYIQESIAFGNEDHPRDVPEPEVG